MNAYPKKVFCIGIGGIQVSALAKFLHAQGVEVCGADAAESEMTKDLRARGIDVVIGDDPEATPQDAQFVVYSSAVPETHPQRRQARMMGIQQFDSFTFLAAFLDAYEVTLITGTHGKSTTTAMTALLAEAGELDPTVIVGSKVPSWELGNLRLGASHRWIIEGDEYAKHFLAFRPKYLVINNIELDHVDIYPTLEHMVEAFRELLHHVQGGGCVVANADDANVRQLLAQEEVYLSSKQIRVVTFGRGAHADKRIKDIRVQDGKQKFLIESAQGIGRMTLSVPGVVNVMNATAASTLASVWGVRMPTIERTMATFKGIWRRFEIVRDDEVLVVSDYGHHPSAVRATLQAAREMYPHRRVVLCFQPHHHQRTRELFWDFVPSFDDADVLVLCEIYDVAGREEARDQMVSSRDLVEAVARHDVERGATRDITYASTPGEAVTMVRERMRKGDVVLFMSAGDLYNVISTL